MSRKKLLTRKRKIILMLLLIMTAVTAWEVYQDLWFRRRISEFSGVWQTGNPFFRSPWMSPSMSSVYVMNERLKVYCEEEPDRVVGLLDRRGNLMEEGRVYSVRLKVKDCVFSPRQHIAKSFTPAQFGGRHTAHFYVGDYDRREPYLTDEFLMDTEIGTVVVDSNGDKMVDGGVYRIRTKGRRVSLWHCSSSAYEEETVVAIYPATSQEIAGYEAESKRYLDRKRKRESGEWYQPPKPYKPRWLGWVESYLRMFTMASGTRRQMGPYTLQVGQTLTLQLPKGRDYHNGMFFTVCEDGVLQFTALGMLKGRTINERIEYGSGRLLYARLSVTVE